MPSQGEYHPFESHSYTSDMPIALTQSDRLQAVEGDTLDTLHKKKVVLAQRTGIPISAAELQSLSIMRPILSLKIF